MGATLGFIAGSFWGHHNHSWESDIVLEPSLIVTWPLWVLPRASSNAWR